MKKVAITIAALAVITLAACSGSSDAGKGNATGTTAANDDDTTLRGTIDLKVDDTSGACDVLDARDCLLPFPSDFFTVADSTTATGRRVKFDAAAMPKNKDGKAIDPSEWNRNDGFSPGTPIMTFVPGLDAAASRLAPVTDIGSSLDPNAPIVIMDASTYERRPYFAELDAKAPPGGDQLLMVHPAISLTEGHRYIVALRDLKGTNGTTIAAPDAFRAVRDRLGTTSKALEDRRSHENEILSTLSHNGVERDNLYLAWDFTVSSTRSLSERMLHIRDDALNQLGDKAPAFTITKVEPNIDDKVARRITGTFTVPSYLAGDGSAGNGFENGSDGLPKQNGKIDAPFTCIVPASATQPSASPARASLYGHGLLGSSEEVGAGQLRTFANSADIVFCGTDWLGLSQSDIGNAVKVIGDFSTFHTIPDRLQQGILDSVVLGRLMTRPNGLTSDPAFQRDGKPIYDTSALYYDGNSLGGVVGGAAVAVSPDVHRAVLGVPAMDFSLLLDRSKDFDQFDQVFRVTYPDELQRKIIVGLAQMLWDRGETNGYAQHLTHDPYPGTPVHTVLMHVAYGDFQVSPVAAEVEARTIGARIAQPAVDPGRSPDKVPYWGIQPIESFPYEGSAIVIWDSGTPTPPLTNTIPTQGKDPHEDPRNDPGAQQQKSEFLRSDGKVVDVCNAKPCKDQPR